MADNTRNLHYFEASSMRDLFGALDTWQGENQKRLLSLNVQHDANGFCCIALTNPTEVIIMDGDIYGGVEVRSNALKVWSD